MRCRSKRNDALSVRNYQFGYDALDQFLQLPFGPAVQLAVSAPASLTAGSSFNVVVTALDAYGRIVLGYTGTVAFTSSDRFPAMLPGSYTFTNGDRGTHTFRITLFTAGMQTLTVTDTANSSILGIAMMTVIAAPANHFLLTAPLTAVSGMPFDVTVTALDPYGNVDTNYAGTVSFTSSDSDPAVLLPGSYTFQPSDDGRHIFDTGIALITPGDQTLTATDTANGNITGSAIVTVSAPPAPPPGGSANAPLNRPASTPVQAGQQFVLVDRLFASVNGKDSWFMVPGRKYHASANDLFLEMGDLVV